MTSACPGVAGLMSMKETVCSSESTIWAGASPATIAQKMQSFIRANPMYSGLGRVGSADPQGGGRGMKWILGLVVALVGPAALAGPVAAATPRASIGDVSVAE